MSRFRANLDVGYCFFSMNFEFIPSFSSATMLKAESRHFERSVREALEIQRHRSAPKFGGMNQDEGQYLKTSFWMPFMDTITKEERDRQRRAIQKRERETNQIQELSDVRADDLPSI